MTNVGHTPLRRCLGCRKSRRKDELIRLVYIEGRGVVMDVGQKMPGRGAYLCNDDGCLRRGLDAKALSNAFKRRVTIDGNLRKSITSIFQGDEKKNGHIRLSLASIGGGE
jgi:predicted RNA-binding protein YlxR (DUF448 family)